MPVRQEGLPELVSAWNSLARDAASNLKIQIGIADDGGFRTEADTTRDLGYRQQEWAIYAANERKAGRTPQAINVWRPINAFGTSFHNYGAARDAKIISRPAGMSYDAAVKAVRGILARNGLRGISSVNDQLHFELPISLAEAKRRWEAYKAQPAKLPPMVTTAPAPGDDDGLDSGNIDAGDDDSDGGTATDAGAMQTKPAGKALLGALVGIVVLGGVYLVARRLTS
jgi:hypothetical protein